MALWLLAPASALAAQQASVKESTVNLRAGPSTGNSIVGKAARGEKLEVLTKSGDWYQVRKGSLTCWVAGWLVTLSGSSEEISRAGGSSQAVVKGDFVNLRGGAGTGSRIVGKALQGEKLPVLAKSGDWYQVRKGNLTCWVAGWLVDIRQAAPSQTVQTGGAVAPASAGGSQIVVTGELVNIRSGPGTGFNVVSKAAKGSKYSVLDKSGNWYKLASGWIYEPLTRISSPTTQAPANSAAGSSTQAVVSGNEANIRSGPGTGFNVVSRAMQGDRLTVVEKSSDWYKVKLPDGNTGWMVAWLLEEQNNPAVPSDSVLVPGSSGTQPPQNTSGGAGSQGGQYVPPPRSADQSKPADEEKPVEQDKPSDQDKPAEIVSDGVLKQVSGRSQGDNSIITIKSDGTPIKYSIISSLSNRLVLDIQGLEPGKCPESITLNSKLVSKIRIGLYESNPAVTRVVLDLKSRVSYQKNLSSREDKLELVLMPRGAMTVAGSKIVLDPGHGGSDPGAIGPNGLYEKTVNLDIALKTAQILRDKGATVIMTRTGDSYVDLYERPEIANRNDADLFVSIHSNSTTNRATAGTSTYHVREPEEGMEEIKAEGISLARSIQNSLVKSLGRQDKGVMQANFVVLVKSAVPAALVEVAYLSNQEEVKLLGNESFRLKAANSIADGIAGYFKGN
ncbi:MAG: hypothetical protein JL50_17670 [Peptococcaceae bacterium BICA1-7]|nr:MAG: hypothetical protein JL50_17670 [Peptococcaceae bacterium BICA1-7]